MKFKTIKPKKLFNQLKLDILFSDELCNGDLNAA